MARCKPPYTPGDEFEFLGFRMRCLSNSAILGDTIHPGMVVAAMYVSVTGELKGIVFFEHEFEGLRASSRSLRHGCEGSTLVVE